MALASKLTSPRSFMVAQKHSARVKWLRWVLPAIGVVGIIGFFGASFLKQSAVGGLGLSGVSVDSSGITMDRPFLTGHDKSGRKYEVSAQSARQELGKPKQMWLDTMVASLQLPNNGWMKITAGSGLYDGETEILVLKDNIHVVSNQGYVVDLSHAHIELKNGVIRSDAPVKVMSGEADSVNSERFFVSNGGESIVFDGRVRMNMQTIKAEPIPDLVGDQKAQTNKIRVE